ncbi:hypothetical protein ACFFRR_010943 [Megaselia abdita]
MMERNFRLQTISCDLQPYSVVSQLSAIDRIGFSFIQFIIAILMGFRQFRIYDFLNISLIAIFAVTFTVILFYWICNGIHFGIEAFKKHFTIKNVKVKDLLDEKPKDEKIQIEVIEIDNKYYDTASMETAYESADEGKDIKCHI